MTAYIGTWVHDPDESLDYPLDWSRELAESGDSIISSTWTAAGDGELMLDPTVPSDTATAIWLSGGTAGTTYYLTNHITTDSAPPREFERTVRVLCRDK